jgi:hypothetical protein
MLIFSAEKTPTLGLAMRSNQASPKSCFAQTRKEPTADVAPPVLHSMPLDRNMIERAAKSLFEAVFARCARLDGKRSWANCDEEIKEGFRSEAIAVIKAVWPFMTLVQPSDQPSDPRRDKWHDDNVVTLQTVALPPARE